MLFPQDLAIFGETLIGIDWIPGGGTFCTLVQIVQSCHVFRIQLKVVDFRVCLDPTRRH